MTKSNPTIHDSRRIVQALFTCSQWWSDNGSGLPLLSLGTCRKLHSAQHRADCLRDIADNLAYCRASESAEMQAEIPRLEDLAEMVKGWRVGREWMSDRDHLRIGEALYQRGQLGKLLW